jgi:hypothetical protein
MFGPVQVRAARAILGWSIKELAREAELHPTRWAASSGVRRTTKGTLALLRAKFEKAGLSFGEDGSVRPPEPTDLKESSS